MMIGGQSRGKVIGREGVLAAAGALALVMTGLLRLTAPLPGPTLPALMLLWALAAMAIVTLCRLAMPAAIRVPLVLGLIGMSIALGACGDLFGVKASGNRLAAADDGSSVPNSVALSSAAVTDTSPPPAAQASAAGAHLALRAASGGDDGWAGRIADALEGRIGGAAALDFTILGEVRSVAPPSVSVTWSIASPAGEARCGTTMVNTAAADPDGAALTDQLAQSFAQAVARSLALGRPACG